MSHYDSPIDLDAQASAAFSDAIMVAISTVSQQLEARGQALTLNSLMGALCAVEAFYIAGIDDHRARKALIREVEKQLPRLVANQRAGEAGESRGKVVAIYQGKTN